jgi:hypothetical protein
MFRSKVLMTLAEVKTHFPRPLEFEFLLEKVGEDVRGLQCAEHWSNVGFLGVGARTLGGEG